MRFKVLVLSLFAIYAIHNNPNRAIGERKELIEFAEESLGIEYDTRNKTGFDCSGFVKHCFAHIGCELPRSSKKQSQFGIQLDVDKAKVGDLLVFTGSNSKNRQPGHVAIVQLVDGDRIYFIHSSSSEGVIINHTEEPYYNKRLLHATRLIED